MKLRKSKTQFYTVSVRTYVIPFYYGSGSGSRTVINYGSGSDFLARYGSGSASQKVTVPTFPVPVLQRWGDTFSCGKGGGRVPIRTRGHTL